MKISLKKIKYIVFIFYSNFYIIKNNRIFKGKKFWKKLLSNIIKNKLIKRNKF